MRRKLETFSSKYHDLGKGRLTTLRPPASILQCNTFVDSSRQQTLLDLAYPQQGGSTYVDLALKLNVLAVFAVFAFVGAILLGAF